MDGKHEIWVWLTVRLQCEATVAQENINLMPGGFWGGGTTQMPTAEPSLCKPCLNVLSPQ